MKVKCDCFNRKDKIYLSGRVDSINCSFCIEGICTADELDISFDGEYWVVGCPKVDVNLGKELK